MPDLAKWREDAENIGFMQVMQGDGAGGELAPLLEVGRANRTHSARQAQIFLLLNVVADRFSRVVVAGEESQEVSRLAKFFRRLCDYGVDYQQTVGAPVNSRAQYLDGVKAVRASNAERGVLGMFPGLPGGK